MSIHKKEQSSYKTSMGEEKSSVLVQAKNGLDPILLTQVFAKKKAADTITGDL